MMPERQRQPNFPRIALAGVRYGLPAAIAGVGIVLAALGTSDAVMGAGVVLMGMGLMVALLNALMRLGFQSQRDRERDEWARRYFDRHGRWPQRGT